MWSSTRGLRRILQLREEILPPQQGGLGKIHDDQSNGSRQTHLKLINSAFPCHEGLPTLALSTDHQKVVLQLTKLMFEAVSISSKGLNYTGVSILASDSSCRTPQITHQDSTIQQYALTLYLSDLPGQSSTEFLRTDAFPWEKSVRERGVTSFKDIRQGDVILFDTTHPHFGPSHRGKGVRFVLFLSWWGASPANLDEAERTDGYVIRAELAGDSNLLDPQGKVDRLRVDLHDL